MNNGEIIRRLRSLISLFYEEETELIANSKKAILGNPDHNKVCDISALFDFLETAIVDMFLNFESCGEELNNCKSNLKTLAEECKTLFEENARLKEQLSKRNQ